MIYKCPKCDSHDAYIELDSTMNIVRHVLRCRCGMYAYVTDETLKTYEVEQKTPVVPSMPPLTKYVRVEPAVRLVDPVPVQVVVPSDVKLAAPSAIEAFDVTECAWEDCSEPSRDKSKYCSKNCSNKNARKRYRARRAG